MAAEFYATFQDPDWPQRQRTQVANRLKSMNTFVKRLDDAFWFQGTEKDDATGRWPFDVRIFMQKNNRIMLEVSAHPPSIETDLSSFFTWLRSQTSVDVLDEDGEKSSW